MIRKVLPLIAASAILCNPVETFSLIQVSNVGPLRSIPLQRHRLELNFSEEVKGNEDWRSFRARLVSAENDVKRTETGSAWIYNSGTHIEKGTILLSRTHELSQFALSEQFKHKSVVMVLDHNQSETTGIVLNRPTDLILYDREENGYIEDWNIWFGGENFGIHTCNPKFYCLHSLSFQEAKDISQQMLEGISFSSLRSAKDLVTRKLAKTSDFVVFSGFVKWSSDDLKEEIDNGLWHAAATDANIIKKGFSILKDRCPRANGDRTWKLLMRLVDKKNEKNETKSIEDEMLDIWSKTFLEFDGPPLFAQEDYDESQIDLEHCPDIKPGAILRSSPSNSSHLLKDQELHRSTILVLQDDDDISIGAMINMPTCLTADLASSDDLMFGNEFKSKLPLRYGGPLGGHKEQQQGDPMIVCHMSVALKEKNIGAPLGEDTNGIWKIPFEVAKETIASCDACIEDFIVIDGIYVWPKDESKNGEINGGLGGEIRKGVFEIVPKSRTQDIWNAVIKQVALSPLSLRRNMILTKEAWGTERDGELKNERSSLHDRVLMRWIQIRLMLQP